MTKLNQILALEKTAKSRAEKGFTEAYHLIQKTPLLSGLSRVYTPKDDEGENLPSETSKVQVNVENVIQNVGDYITRLIDLEGTKEKSNATASADVVIDGNVIIPDAPVTFLLFLEKKLVDIYTFVSKLPTLDPTEDWTWDSNRECFVSSTVHTNRSKKIPRNHVKAPATDKHPAQVEVWHEDVIVGTWATQKFSGALPQEKVTDTLERVVKLQEAVKVAREEANSVDVTDYKVGENVIHYIFG